MTGFEVACVVLLPFLVVALTSGKPCELYGTMVSVLFLSVVALARCLQHSSCWSTREDMPHQLLFLSQQFLPLGKRISN